MAGGGIGKSVKDRVWNSLWRQGRFAWWGRERLSTRYDLTERVIDAGLCDPWHGTG